jgi:hypothetical protein
MSGNLLLDQDFQPGERGFGCVQNGRPVSTLPDPVPVDRSQRERLLGREEVVAAALAHVGVRADLGDTDRAVASARC